MKVIILCGGYGTRLAGETEYKPKPMVQIGNRPILWHIMKSYAYYGYKDFILCVGYQGHIIKEYFLNYEAMNNDFTICLGNRSQIELHENHSESDFRVSIVDTGLDVMTGARIKKVEKFIDEDTFMLTYGDGLCDINIAELVAYHRAHGKIGTVTSVQPTSKFGILNLDDQNNVVNFKEKPKIDAQTSAGYFVFKKELFSYLNDHPDCILESKPLEKLSSEGQLVAKPHDGFFYAMDTQREYNMLNQMVKTGETPWMVWKK